MGRVILAAMSTKELDAFLAANPTPKLTSRTITSPVELKKELAKVAETGWALVDQELEIGLRSLAVPIRDDQNKVVAGMNISIQVAPGDSDAMHDKQVEKFLPLLKETAIQLTRAATRSGEIN
jgi:IclR family pca regulon transcriptional regulator